MMSFLFLCQAWKLHRVQSAILHDEVKYLIKLFVIENT